jgi:hypothetical protein
MARRQVRLWTVLPPLRAKGMLGRVLPFHYHRHCTHVSFTAVLGVDVLQHCVSSKRSSVSNVSVEVLGAHLVKTGATDEGQTVLLSNDAVHIIKEYRMSSGVHVISITFSLMVTFFRALYRCPQHRPSRCARSRLNRGRAFCSCRAYSVLFQRNYPIYRNG